MNDAVLIPDRELHWSFSRSSGPGGQSVNTTDSKVRLRFDVANSPSIPDHLRERAMGRLADRLDGGSVTITASKHRSQLENRRSAQHRLVAILAEAFAPPAKARRRTRRSRGSNEKRIRVKKQRSDTKRLRRSVDRD